MLSYTVTAMSGKVLGRHFVLLKGAESAKVEVVDPYKPGTTLEYSLEFKAGEKGAKGRLFLNNPPAIPRNNGSVYEVNTVFTLGLTDGGELAEPTTPATASVEYINRKIDETAKDMEAIREASERIHVRCNTCVIERR